MYIDYPKSPFEVITGACLSLVLCVWVSLSPWLRFLPLLSTLKPKSTRKSWGRSASGEAPWPALRRGSVCHQLPRRQRDLQALTVLNGISCGILLKTSLSSEARENVLLKSICLMMVSQQRVGLKVRGSVCLSLPRFNRGVGAVVSYPPHNFFWKLLCF